jgi:hypothetical protein
MFQHARGTTRTDAQFGEELRLALFPQVSARKFRNWSTEAQHEVDSCLLLAPFATVCAAQEKSGVEGQAEITRQASDPRF